MGLKCGIHLEDINIIKSFLSKNEGVMANAIAKEIIWSFDELELDESNSWSFSAKEIALSVIDFDKNKTDVELDYLNRLSSIYLSKFSGFNARTRRELYQRQISKILSKEDSSLFSIRNDLIELIKAGNESIDISSLNLINIKFEEFLIELALKNDPTTARNLLDVKSRTPIGLAPRVPSVVSALDEKIIFDDSFYFVLRIIGSKEVLKKMIKNNLFTESEAEIERKVKIYGLNEIRQVGFCDYEDFVSFVRASISSGAEIMFSGLIAPFDLININTNKAVTIRGGGFSLFDNAKEEIIRVIDLPNYETFNFYDFDYKNILIENDIFNSEKSYLNMSLLKNCFSNDEIKEEYIYF